MAKSRKDNKRDDLNWNLERAAKRGDRIVVPDAYTLQVDLDSPKALQSFGSQLALLRRRSSIANKWKIRITDSAQRGHCHITIRTASRMSLKVRIALQALLGSDLKRELMNWMRVEKRQKLPILFFEREHCGQRQTR